MSENLQELRKRLLSHKEILVVLSPHFNGDSLLAASALFSTLRQIADEGPVFNVVDLLMTSPLSEAQKSLVGAGVLKYVKSTLDPRNYIISIPKDGKIGKVKWREENEAFKLFLTPAYGDLAISDLKFEQIGSSYKYVVLVGFEKLTDLGEVYTKNKSFFDRAPRTSIGVNGNTINENNLSIARTSSVTEIIYDFLKVLNVKINTETAQLILNGFVESVGGLLGNVKDKTTLERIGELMDLGATMTQVGTKPSTKGTFGQLQLQQRIFANIKQDTSGILWSTVNSSELKDLQIEDSEVNVNEHIPFNSYQGYGNAFVLYGLSDGTIWGKVETEDLDLPKILKEFEMTVCQDGLVIRAEGELEAIETKILRLLGSEDQQVVVEPLVEPEITESKELSAENVEVTAVDEEPASIGILEESVSEVAEQVDESVLPVEPMKPAAEAENEVFSDDPIITSDDSFGPPKIFNSGSFGGPFSGMGNKK